MSSPGICRKMDSTLSSGFAHQFHGSERNFLVIPRARLALYPADKILCFELHVVLIHFILDFLPASVVVLNHHIPGIGDGGDDHDALFPPGSRWEGRWR